MVGVYCIKCIKENKVYIGQSTNIAKRYKDHIKRLCYGTHANHYLQEAFNTHGVESFCLEILREFEKDTTRKELYESEIFFISLFDSTNREKGYNLESGGNSCGRACKETRDKLSSAMKGKFVGRKLSEETKRLMRENHHHYWLGKKHSDETKKLLSEQRKGKPSHWKGKTQTKEHIQKRTEVQFGKIWVHKEDKQRFILREDLEKFLAEGYVLGRPFSKRNRRKKDG